jgi:hypothetical protein
MQSCYAAGVVDVVFDDPNLIADAGLVAVAEQIGLPELVAEHVAIIGAATVLGRTRAPGPGYLPAGVHPWHVLQLNIVLRQALAARLLAEALSTVRAIAPTAGIVVRADSKFYTADVVATAARYTADVSLTTGSTPSVNAAITCIHHTAWTPNHYPQAFVDDQTGELSPTPKSPRSPIPRSPPAPTTDRPPAG